MSASYPPPPGWGSSPIAIPSLGEFFPSDHNLLAWTFDPSGAQAGSPPAAGTLTLARLVMRTAALITNLLLHITSAGVGLTAGQNFAGLWDANGNLLGISADQTGIWNAGGLKTTPLLVPVSLPGGACYVGFWANAVTTLPSFARDGNLSAPLANVGLAAAASRFATANAGLTTVPPNPFAGIAASALTWWAALS